MRARRCAGVSQQSPLLFQPNGNHFSIETIASRDWGQTGADRTVSSWQEKRKFGGADRRKHTKQLSDTRMRNIHTHQRQRPLQRCRGAREGGQQSDYSPLTSEPGRHPDPRGRSDPPELRTDPRAAPSPLRTHTQVDKRRTVRAQKRGPDSQVLPRCCVKRERKQAAGSPCDLWKLRFTPEPDRPRRFRGRGEVMRCGENRRASSGRQEGNDDSSLLKSIYMDGGFFLSHLIYLNILHSIHLVGG